MGLRLILTSVRTNEQGKSVHEKLLDNYEQATSILFMDKGDMDKIGIDNGSNVLVEGEEKSIVLTAKASSFAKEGSCFLALGPFANALVYKHSKDGMHFFKKLEVIIDKTDHQKTKMEDLFK